jgi:ABC transporter substrate binding protein
MRRREFITLVAGGVSAWPLTARAQKAGSLPRIGFLSPSTPSAVGPLVAAFVQRLRELGWRDGQSVFIEYRWAEGRADRISDIVAEFAARKVDVIVTHGNVAVAAAKKATSDIPIVFATANDPLGEGLVASLARPGGNVTGLSLQQTDTAEKRLALLREIIPGLRRLAIIANPDNSGSVQEMRDIESAARTLGFEVAIIKIRRAEDIAPAFAEIKGRADALYVSGDAVTRYPRSISGANLPRSAGWSVTERASITCTSSSASIPAASSKATNRPTCPSRSRQNSTWSSISQPPRRSRSTCRPRCWRWLMR